MRRRFGGRLHARNDGIKPFIQSVRQGYWGYYLPDQDHGPEHSEFVDFFATYKATLPAIGRLMKVCRARVVPLFPIYDGKTHRLTIQVRPPMDDLLEADDHTIARRMNEEVEILLVRDQNNTRILKLLKTRKPGEIQPYKRKDLYPINKNASREERPSTDDKFKFASEDSKSVELSLNCRPDEAFSPHPATYLLYR